MRKDEVRNEPLVKAWLAGALAWAVPGAGHMWQGRVWRGLLLGAVVWVTFVTGLWLRGHLYSLTEMSAGALAQVYSVFNLGTGLLYIVCWVAGVGFTEYAQEPTYEYGNNLLMVAGLLNYLVMLDSFDIGAGRKP